FGHELRNGSAVARALEDEIRYKRHTFGIIELDAPCEPTSSNRRRDRDHELVFFARCEFHTFSVLPTSARPHFRDAKWAGSKLLAELTEEAAQGESSLVRHRRGKAND